MPTFLKFCQFFVKNKQRYPSRRLFIKILSVFRIFIFTFDNFFTIFLTEFLLRPFANFIGIFIYNIKQYAENNAERAPNQKPPPSIEGNKINRKSRSRQIDDTANNDHNQKVPIAHTRQPCDDT